MAGLWTGGGAASRRLAKAASSRQTRGVRALTFLLVLAAMFGAAQAQTLDPLHVAALDYAAYQRDVGAIRADDLDTNADIERAILAIAAHQPMRVARGWIAYEALAAAQSPAFVAGVRSRVNAAGRAPVIRQLVRDLAYARRRPPGSAEALHLIATSTRADAARLRDAAVRVERDARTGDEAPWTTGGAPVLRIAPREAPLASWARRIVTNPLTETPLRDDAAFGGAAFWDGLADLDPPRIEGAARVRGNRADTSDRVLTLAGLFVVGASGSETRRVEFALEDATTRQCLELERLQYLQCVFVSEGPREGAFCLARHGLSGPGACLGAIVE